MNADLEKLASKLKIATSYTDGGLKRKEYSVSDKVIKFFVQALGYKAGNEKQIKDSIAEVENKRWRQALEPIYVCNQNNLIIDVVSPDLSDIKISAKDKSGKETKLDYTYMQNAENKGLFYKESLRINTELEIGYYDLTVTISGKKYETVLAVAPDKCYDVLTDKKIWGYALQLYSVKSKRNWGVGDFTDLDDFIKLCAKDGADIIGLNPLNTLSHDHPENASPYSSISREFLNPIYIDVEKVPEFETKDKKDVEAVLKEVKSLELIDYGKIYPLKISVLEKCFERFKAKKSGDRKKAFDKFCKTYGEALDNLALFQSIYEVKTKEIWGGWRAWPDDLKSPSAKGVKQFAKEHQDRIDFFKFMQFEAFRQFDKVSETIKESGLKIGLYRDLAVGVGQDSAEFWGGNELFMQEAGTGAPPDAFFPAGQKWRLGTFLPQALKDKKYIPFINILRANMQNAGALRIDHVMSLMRLYVIPDAYDEGTYINYNFEDMLNIVALESQLNKCMIVGESIGNVPAGFLEALADKNIYSLSVLWAERWESGWGDFKQPQFYPNNAFASVATHDIAPLKMWWFGYDIEVSASLGLIANDGEKLSAYHKREADRQKLLSALDYANVWPKDRFRSGNYIYGESYPEGIEEAVEAFVAKSASPVYLAQLEDILHITQMQNLPGTDRDKHPNWQRRLTVDLEDLANDSAYIRCVRAIKRER